MRRALHVCNPSPHTQLAIHHTSHPGHTPYSLAGSSSYSDSRIQLAAAEEDEEDSCCTTDMPLITATGVQRARLGQQGGVRMELFTSVIHEVPQEGAEVTPAAAVRRPCWTPGADHLAAGEGEQWEEQGDSTDAAAAAAGAGWLGDAGSEGDSGSECDMELQTPATLPFSARLQRAAVGTAGKAVSNAGKGKASSRAALPFGAGATGVGISTAGKGKASSTAGLPFSAGAVASEVQPLGDARGSPSAGSTFTGFAGGASAEEAAGSATPTFFDGGRRGCAARTSNSGLQSLLAGGSSSTATSSDLTPPARAGAGAAAPGSAGRVTRGQTHAGSSVLDSRTTPAASARMTAAARAAAAAQTHIARLQGSRGAATPPTAPRQRTLQFAAAGERTPAAAQRSLAAACAAAAAAVTPATAPRQRAAHSSAGSDAECSSAAAPSASGTADAEDSFSSPPASTPMPAATPKSKLRQPERVAVEARM